MPVNSVSVKHQAPLAYVRATYFAAFLCPNLHYKRKKVCFKRPAGTGCGGQFGPS